MAFQSRLDALVRKYLDGRASDAERAELERLLVESPEAAEVFAEASWMDRWLADLLKKESSLLRHTAFVQEIDRRCREADSRRRRVRTLLVSWKVWAGVAACVLIALGLSLWNLRPGSEAASAVARLEQVQGEVYLVTQGARIAARSGQEVVSGQGVQTAGEDSFAVVVYADGTRLEVGADTTLSELSGGQETGKRVVLADGFLTADVSRQPPGQPMLLATPHAEVVILGTRFNLSKAADATHIEMEKGAVQLTRKSDGQSIEVQTGHAAVVASDAQPMVTQRLAPRLSAVRTIIDAHDRPVHTVRYAPDGRTLASVGREGTVKLWEAATGEERITLPEHAGPVRSLAFSRDGQMLVAGAGVGAIRVWRLAAEPVGTTLPGPEDEVQGPGDILALALSPDGRSLTVVGRSSGSVYRWETVPGNKPPVLIGRMGRLGCAALFLEGQVLATGHHRSVIKLWDLTSGKIRDTFRLQEDPSPGPEITALAFAPDGRTLAVGSGDGIVRLLDPATGQVRATLLGHTHRVLRAAFSPDGRTLATGSRDRTARLWDVAEGKERATLQGHQQGVAQVAFSPDGSTLATGGIDGSLRFWDVPVD